MATLPIAHLRKDLTRRIERLWYDSAQPRPELRLLSKLFGAIARRRRRYYSQPQHHYHCPLPVIVIGNLTVGGTGKSPLAAWLVDWLQEVGYHPALITRGYGGNAARYPLLVTSETSPGECGDEPLMLSRQCRVPVIVDPDRSRAAAWAAAEGLGNILVCDDGLQHYRLGRSVELAVFDGARGAGNGAMLPAGPLREPLTRLESVTAAVINGKATHPTFSEISRRAPATVNMVLEPQVLRNLVSGETSGVGLFDGTTVHGVAGIGNPERFFKTLEALGCVVRRHIFPDHHRFQPGDFPTDDLPVVMTAKDSVKCEAFGRANWWALEVAARPEPGLGELILKALRARNGR